MYTIAAWWFGVGTFSALMQLLQAHYEDEKWYAGWVWGNVLMILFTGPVSLITQMSMGMPIIPRRTEKK